MPKRIKREMFSEVSFRNLISAFLVGLILLFPAAAISEEEMVQLRIFASKSTVCVNQPLLLEVDLHNSSAHPVKIGNHGITGIHYQARRSTPNQLSPDFDSLDINPGAAGEPVAPLILQPRVSQRYIVSLNEKFFHREGFYKVKIDYQAQYKMRSQGNRKNTLQNGNIESNWLIFEVEECE